MLDMIISSASLTFRVSRIKVKVIVAIFRKTLPSVKHLYLLMDFNINLHTNVRYDNISSKFDFQGPGIKVKVTVDIFRKILSLL